MPLVRIDLLQGKPKEYVAAIGESVHRAMVGTIGVPARDHFQVITEHAPGYLVYDPHYLEVNRSDDLVLSRFSYRLDAAVNKSKASSNAWSSTCARSRDSGPKTSLSTWSRIRARIGRS
jgi:4-oxalocrotonate tautomerase